MTMIKANELRIGNWVCNGDFEGGTFYFKISTIANDVIAAEPIPLTPEILVKAGFVKRDASRQSWYWYLGEARFRMLANGNIKSYGLSTMLIISSLHQLQNLYFALTGQELKIEL